MLTKRIVACLDVRDGKLAKSVKFVDTRDIGDPLERASLYYQDGLDELVFYDITASSDRRNIMIDVVEAVAARTFIPFSVGGGIRSVEDATKLRLAGAEKVNVNSAAVQDPELIQRISQAIGAQSTILSMDILRVEACEGTPSGYEIVIDGGRTRTGRDALAWAKQGEALGAGELVVNSIDADGTRDGYEIALTRMIAEAVGVPVIASGGAGKPEHLYAVLTEGKADAALVASMVHFGDYKVSELKRYLADRGLPIRMCW
ncbi:MAG: imidazole glycerol phosphate synthase subunit HisF [Myxococcales bacterium]|nr:imidazole glycerol phosphate synthase subunit HisF [Myxococcales bacterium]MDD9966802.1 imidazole glycerol phosphate synthase subunit HisF [Myxococcales bacterium]